MSLLTAIFNDMMENYVKRSYRDAHYMAFSTRIPADIREKLTEDDIRHLSDISLEILHNAANTIKDQIASKIGSPRA